MIRFFFIIIFLCSQISFSWAVYPTGIVYRVDSRELNDIHEAGGMWPLEDGIPDNDLMHHFTGESLDGMCSNFVSTSQSLASVVEHAMFLASTHYDSYDPEFVTYIYVIRPDLNFYDVRSSFVNTLNNTTDEEMINGINRLLASYVNMDELAARQGFSQNRIISYARLDSEMIQQYGSALYSESFWLPRWINNPRYNFNNDPDISNSEPYQHVGSFNGSVLEVVNDNQSTIRIGNTCLGVSPYFNKESKTKLKESCSKHQIMNVKSRSIK